MAFGPKATLHKLLSTLEVLGGQSHRTAGEATDLSYDDRVLWGR